MTRKLLICPYFGDKPPWMLHYWRNAARLYSHGYDFYVDDDEDGFRRRVKALLGVECPPMRGSGKVWDFRPAFGILYADEIDRGGYQFWGHTDFDCVYGRVEQWVTDEFLEGLDIFSNHATYVCGPWSLYRNVPTVNELFMLYPRWREILEDPTPTGWIEKEYTSVADALNESGDIALEYRQWQTNDLDSFDRVHLDEDGALYEGWTEIMMAHFRRNKVYPAGCVFPRGGVRTL